MILTILLEKKIHQTLNPSQPKKLKLDNLRSRLNKELEKTSADVDDDSGTEDGETERLPGMFADLLPLEGTNSVRCRYCIKLLINEKQILDHVRSRRHKKKYRQAKLAGMSKAALEHRQTRENARKKKRLEKRFAHKEANKREKGSVNERLLKIRKRNPSDLTEEQIRKRKEKFQRKKTRRLERSQV